MEEQVCQILERERERLGDDSRLYRSWGDYHEYGCTKNKSRTGKFIERLQVPTSWIDMSCTVMAKTSFQFKLPVVFLHFREVWCKTLNILLQQHCQITLKWPYFAYMKMIGISWKPVRFDWSAHHKRIGKICRWHMLAQHVKTFFCSYIYYFFLHVYKQDRAWVM